MIDYWIPQVQGFGGPFPVDMFYRQWKNTEGQVSLFQQILRNPDIFNFVDYSHHAVALEVMKVNQSTFYLLINPKF